MGALAPPASAQSSDWVIFAHDSTLVGARATVHGDVVVQDARTASHLADSAELTLDVDASVLGSLTADSVSLRARASVSGGVIMNDFKADATATTGSTPTSPASLPLDFMFGDAPEMSAPENAPSVTVSAGGFDELAPGEYGTVTLASGDAEEPTILVLGQGEYVLGDLILGDHAFFAFQADAFVIVTGRLSVGDASYIGLTIEPPAGLTYDQTGVIVLGQNGSDGAMLSTPAAATFGTGSMANTQIWAPNGTLQIGADDFFMGRAAGRWVAVGTDAVVATPGSSCGHGIMPESIECWDGDLCTSDSCVSGACAHGEIPNCDASPPQWPEQAWLMAEPAGDGDASLTWTAATDNIAVTSYQILQDGSLIAEVAGTETSAIIEDLGYGTWHLAIVAKDAAGNLSQTMTTLDLILSDTAPPTWPIPFQAEDVHATWVDLSWSAAADNVGVDHYELRQDGVLIANLGSTVTSYRAESLPLGTLVDFSLHALDAAQNRSDFGPTWGILTRDSDPPETDPSSILNATLDGYGLVVDWSQASWTDDEGVAGYGILVFANGYWTGTSASPPSTSVSFESLWAPTYAVVVVAQDAAGNSSTPVTASINMVAETIPPTWDPGTQFKAIASSPVTADFFWSSAYDASGVVAYRILEAGQARLEVQGNRTQATLWDFSPDTTHTFQIQAVDFWGNTATFPTEITPRPQTDRPTWIGAPFMSATPISGTELQLDWSLGSSEFDFVYELMILPVDPTVPGGFAGIFGPGVTTARVTGLSPRVAYVATVLLRDDYRLEAIEKPSTLVVMPNDWSALPSIQTGLQARLGTVSSQVRSTWDGVLDAVTPAERESITKRCDAMGLRGSTLSVGTDGRGQVTSLSACRMSLATSVGPGAGPEAIAKAFVADNAALFAIDPTEMVGRVGLETVSIHAERAGGSRVRLVQSIDGLPVFTSQFRVVVSPDGYVTRAGGHLTPPAAVSWASGGVTDEQAKATAAEAFGADPTAGVTLLAGIYDSAAGGFTGKPAVLAWRARVHGHPSAPDAYIDRGDGSVLRLDERGASMTWDELAPAERRVEAFSQEVQPCTEFNAVTGVCTVTGTITAKPLLAVAPYVNPEMLQYSTITETTPGSANHCGNPTPPGTGEFFTYCADAVTGALAPCVQDAPECRAAEPSANGEALADALNGVGAFYYEWTGSVGWDKDADATLHRLRAVTDFRSVAGQVANLCEISSAFDLLADSQPRPAGLREGRRVRS
ncbi:MAG: hypothetical protein R3F39_04355 [Myxococcota bacterium]